MMDHTKPKVLQVDGCRTAAVVLAAASVGVDCSRKKNRTGHLDTAGSLQVVVCTTTVSIFLDAIR